MLISGTGCAVADYLYNCVDFAGDAFRGYRSRVGGDGGLVPGGLVFREDFERFSGASFADALPELTGGRAADSFNVGGPAIVALITAAQLLTPTGDYRFRHFGAVGNDDVGRDILERVRKTPVDISNYQVFPELSPFTSVLSDPDYDGGHGERAFVNNIGSSGRYGPEHLTDSFYGSDIVLFGATALVPRLHQNLSGLLEKAKANGAATIVTTVYDFQSEQANPGGKWPLGDDVSALKNIDLLIADQQEALCISGTDDLDAACDYFIRNGLGAFAITHGPNPIRFYSSGAFFAGCPLSMLPVSELVVSELRDNPSLKGDTTGCGDNFGAGMLASLAVQMGADAPSLPQAVALGVSAGGNACYRLGGVAQEKESGELAREITRLYSAYREQVAECCELAEMPWR